MRCTMSDLLYPPPGQEPEAIESQFDSEIDARSFAIFGVWLAIALVIVVALMYWMYRDLQRREVARDAPATPLVDRSIRRLPPEPHLQVTPEVDLQTYREAQTHAVEGFGWIDEQAGIVHVPVERAMDLLLERGGLPSRASGTTGSAALPVQPAPSQPVQPPAPTHAAPHTGGHR
jgi:hypothetical protein